MELQEAVKLLIKHGEIINDLVGTPKDKKCKTQMVIDTVLAELDRLQQENEEKDSVIKDMQDELRHIPSIVSETM